MRIPYAAAWGKGQVLRRRAASSRSSAAGPTDNTSALLAKLAARRSGQAGAAETRGDRRRPAWRPSPSAAAACAPATCDAGAALVVEGLRVRAVPGRSCWSRRGSSAGHGAPARRRQRPHVRGLATCASRCRCGGCARCRCPRWRWPAATSSPLPELGLTGITGHHPAGAGGQRQGRRTPQPLVVALQGSYGGARESLWRATGEVKPPLDGRAGRAGHQRAGGAVLPGAHPGHPAALDPRAGRHQGRRRPGPALRRRQAGLLGQPGGERAEPRARGGLERAGAGAEPGAWPSTARWIPSAGGWSWPASGADAGADRDALGGGGAGRRASSSSPTAPRCPWCPRSRST